MVPANNQFTSRPVHMAENGFGCDDIIEADYRPIVTQGCYRGHVIFLNLNTNALEDAASYIYGQY